jgi:hypothetical protein
VIAIQQIEQPLDADFGTILRPRQRLKIGDARLQRFAHRADAGHAALGRALQHDAERYRVRTIHAGWRRTHGHAGQTKSTTRVSVIGIWPSRQISARRVI